MGTFERTNAVIEGEREKSNRIAGLSSRSPFSICTDSDIPHRWSTSIMIGHGHRRCSLMIEILATIRIDNGTTHAVRITASATVRIGVAHRRWRQTLTFIRRIIRTRTGVHVATAHARIRSIGTTATTRRITSIAIRRHQRVISASDRQDVHRRVVTLPAWLNLPGGSHWPRIRIMTRRIFSTPKSNMSLSCRREKVFQVILTMIELDSVVELWRPNQHWHESFLLGGNISWSLTSTRIRLPFKLKSFRAAIDAFALLASSMC